MNNSDFQSGGESDDGSNRSDDPSKLKADSSISDSVMKIGRDEMNLADFPLAGLASRPPKGKMSLAFEDSVWDKRQKTWINKRLTIAASTEYGLPAASDDEVILGLVQMTYAARFTDRKLVFVPAELFRVLGWRGEGRDYSRLEESLKRWVGVTLYYDHAWWDKRLKTWMDEHFHLLDSVVIPRRRNGRGKGVDRGRRPPWTVTWNETVFKSFQDGYLRRFDMGEYRKLKSTAAKRMYRFLGKRFHFTNHLTFNLRVFACERVGFNRKDDNSQLKRRLDRAIRELEDIGLLTRLTKEQRYRQLRRGDWEVTFVRKRKPTEVKPGRSTSNTLEAALVARGVRETAAADLIRNHSPAAIRRCLTEFDGLRERGGDSNLNNPAGLLVTWINRSRDVPCDSSSSKAESKVSELAEGEAAESRTKLEAIRGHLAKLSLEERESLEADAMKAADPVRRAGYRRAVSAGNSRLLAEYRNAIIESHVLRLLGGGSG